ncbi:MAG: hypothetical protein WDO73_02080 [Ignavibacteriota bacterium]
MKGSDRQVLDGIETGVHEWPKLYGQYMKAAIDGHFPEAHDIMLDRIYPLVENLDKAAEQLQARQRADLATASVAAGVSISNNRVLAFSLARREYSDRRRGGLAGAWSESIAPRSDR